MIPVAKIGVEEDKVFQVWGCTEEWQEYLGNFLSIPLNITHIYKSQCVERGTFSQLLEYRPYITHLHLISV